MWERGLLQTLGVFPRDGPGCLSTADWLFSVEDGVFDEADDSEVPKTALLSHAKLFPVEYPS